MLRRLALVSAVLLGAIGLGAIGLPQVVGAASTARPVDGLSTAQATAVAASALATAGTAKEPDGSIPLVTVEIQNGRPVITRHDVTTVAEATTVISSASKGNDLASVAVDRPVTMVGAISNDTYIAQQWALSSTSFPAAWATTRGAGVTVAVVDSGVQANHPDLVGKVLAGRQFLAGDPAGATFDGNDPNGHGTHVAGAIAAIADNATGIAGAAPAANILPVRVLDATGSGWSSDVASGVIWAADNGARVINMSLGSSSPTSALESAINYATAKGVVVFAAAGNTGSTSTQYPAAYPNAIAVAAFDSTLTRASFSTMNAVNSLAAPGVGIISTVPSGYQSMSGTSMATPYAAAAGALVISAKGSLTVAQVRAALESTAIDAGTPGRDAEYGFGRIDPAAAVASVLGTPTTSPTTTAPATTTPATTVPATTTPVTTVPVTTTPVTTTPATTAPVTTTPVTTVPSPTTTTPRTTVPATPAAPTLSAPTINYVAVTWPTVSGATSYRISRNGAFIATSASNSYIDTSVNPSTTYAYTVAAVSKGGTSAQSPESKVTTPARTAPPTITLSLSSTGKVSITVTPASNATVTYLSKAGWSPVRINGNKPVTYVASIPRGKHTFIAQSSSPNFGVSTVTTATIKI